MGTEAFPDLGRHCQLSECNQLDFLPFRCDSCRKVFCVEHRSHKAHDCPISDHKSRRVLICEACSVSIDITGCDEGGENEAMERHEKSGNCDPAKKIKKPACPVRRCKAVLTFSNTSTCKTCDLKVCLRHRFPEDHACRKSSTAVTATKGWNNSKFLVALAARESQKCGKEGRRSASPPTTPHSVKAC